VEKNEKKGRLKLQRKSAAEQQISLRKDERFIREYWTKNKRIPKKGKKAMLNPARRNQEPASKRSTTIRTKPRVVRNTGQFSPNGGSWEGKGEKLRVKHLAMKVLIPYPGGANRIS